MILFSDLLILGPEIALAVCCIASVLLGVLYKSKFENLSYFLGASALLSVCGYVAIGPLSETLGSGAFSDNEFTRFVKITILVVTSLVMLYSARFCRVGGISGFEFPVLVMFAVIGMLMMVSSNDFIFFYVGLEMQSLALYVLAAYRTDDIRSTESGVKYFVLGALASAILLFGVSLVYGSIGSIEFGIIKQFAIGSSGSESLPLTLGLVLILSGLAFKISAVPFHMWTPDVYEGAPAPVTAFLATAPKFAALALTVRILFEPFGGLVADWSPIVWVMAAASMMLGAFAGISQRNIKRLIAYSSIGNIGFALIGVASTNEVGVRGLLVFMSIYLVAVLGVFACLLCVRVNGRVVENIGELSGLSKSNPLIAFALAVFMFSFAGIPPLAGFFGKFYVLVAAVEAGLYVLAVIGVVTSVVSAFYYLRIVKIMYFDDLSEETESAGGNEIKVLVGLTATLVTGFVLVAYSLVGQAEMAASALFRP